MNTPDAPEPGGAPATGWRRWFNRKLALRAGGGALLFFALKGLAWVALAVWALR